MTNVESKSLYFCWTKGTNRESGEPRFAFAWATSRRGWFKVFADRVECGNWTIPFSEVQQVTVFRSRMNWVPVTVLRFELAHQTYQFGFNPWAKPDQHLKVPYREETVKMRYSLFSALVRMFLLVYLAYAIWSFFLGQG